MDWYLVLARGLNFGKRLYVDLFFLHEHAVKALVIRSASTAASKRWCLIDNTISTNILMSWPIFNKAAMSKLRHLAKLGS